MKRRLELLKRLRNEISANEEEIIAALAEDLGKSRTEAYMTEIGMTLSELSCAIRNALRQCPDHESVELPFPALHVTSCQCHGSREYRHTEAERLLPCHIGGDQKTG